MEKEKKVYKYKSFTYKVKQDVYDKKLKDVAEERGQTVSGLIKRTLELALNIKLKY